jgi:REP element-mobilizing transposase RayT
MGCLPLRVGGIEDHVHILARFGATACLANVVRDLKRSSTKWIREELAVTGFSWQEGYAALSVSSERLAVVERYIARQAEHHRKISAKDELLKLLAYAQIEFDSKYLE